MNLCRSLRLTAAAVAACSLLALAPARADVITNGCANVDVSCSLEELLTGGSIRVNDKLFDNWFLEVLDSSVFPDLSLVDVVGLDDGGLDPGPGLAFLGNGELAVSDGDFIDLRFSFDVIDEGPFTAIVDNSLALVEYLVIDDAIVTIDETVFGEDLLFLGNKHVEADGLFPDADIPFDEIAFPPQQRLFVEKNILLVTGFGGFADLAQFEQRFSQIRTIPAPPTLGLTVLAMLGLGAARLRRAPR